MQILENFSLKSLNTFGIQSHAKYFTEIKDIPDLQSLLHEKLFLDNPYLILGGGSNILFLGDFPGIVIRICLKGIQVIETTHSHILVKCMAGEDWEGFVSYCVENNFGGLENLTMIPGNTGTSPMQNIGAYGVEIKDHFHCLEALEIKTGKIKAFFGEDCSFGYRESFFKREGKDQYVILSVTFRLSRDKHQLRLDYGSVRDEIRDMKIENPGIIEVKSAVKRIRERKIPDPKVLGNVGSFFKNPLVSREMLDIIRQDYPDVPAYEGQDGTVKLAAGWLIEKSGWKGYREGEVGVHKNQALVLVNYGEATGMEIYRLSEKILESVKSKFGILLDREVNLAGKPPF